MVSAFRDCLNNLCPFQDHEDVLLYFPLKVFFFSFIFRFGIHLELFNVYGVR